MSANRPAAHKKKAGPAGRLANQEVELADLAGGAGRSPPLQAKVPLRRLVRAVRLAEAVARVGYCE